MKIEKSTENLIVNDENEAIINSIIEEFKNSASDPNWEISINQFLKDKNVRINTIVIGIIGTTPERIYIGSNTNIILVFDRDGNKIDEIEIDYETEIIGLYIASVTEEFTGNNLIVSTSDNSIIFFEAEDGENYRELSESIDERRNDITTFFPLCSKDSYENKFLLLGYSSGEVKAWVYDKIRDKNSSFDIIKKEDIIDREEIVGICGSFNLIHEKIGIVVAYKNGVLLLYDQDYHLIKKHDLRKAVEKMFFLESENAIIIITDEYEITYFTIEDDGFNFIWNYRQDALGTAIVPDGDGNFYVLFEDTGLVTSFNKKGNIRFTSDPSINGTSGYIWDNCMYISSNEGEIAKYKLLPSDAYTNLTDKLFRAYSTQLNSFINEDEFAVWFNEEFEQPEREAYFIEFLNNGLDKDLFNGRVRDHIIYLFANKKYDTETASGLKEKIRSSYVLRENLIQKFANTIVAKELEGFESETIIDLDIENKADCILLSNPDDYVQFISKMEKLRVNRIDVLWKNRLVESDDIIDVTTFHDPFVENNTQILAATKKGKVALIDKATGKMIWHFHINMDDGIINNILVTDICHDGRKEIILGLENYKNSIIILTESNTKYDGNKINFNLQKIDLVWGEGYINKDNYCLFQAHCYSPGIANKTVHKVSSFDFDKDGLDDLIISSENGSFNVFYFDRDARQNIKTSRIQIIENDDDESEDILDFCFIRNSDDSITLYTGSQTGKIEKHNFNGTRFEKENLLISDERYGKEAQVTDILITDINSKRCIIFSSEDNFVYCLYENLEYKWSYKAGGNITSIALAESEGSKYIFCATDDNMGNLIALDLSGNKVWDFPFFKPLQKIFFYDNYLIIADSDGFIYWAQVKINKELTDKIEISIKNHTVDYKSLLNNQDDFLRIYACRKLIENNHFSSDTLSDIRNKIDDTREFTSRVRHEVLILIASSVLASENKQNLLELLIKPIKDEDNSEEVRLESVKSFIRFFDLYKANNFNIEEILHSIVHDKDEYVKAYIAGELGQLFLNNKELNATIWSTTKHFLEANIEEDWVISETFNSVIKIFNYTDDIQVINSIINEIFELDIENDIYLKFKKKIFNKAALTLFEIYESLYHFNIHKLSEHVKGLNSLISAKGVNAVDKEIFMSFVDIINLSHSILSEDNFDELINDKHLVELSDKHFSNLENLKVLNHSLKEYSESINTNEKIRIISQMQQEIKEFSAIKDSIIQSKFAKNLLVHIIENKVGNMIEDYMVFLLESVNLEIDVDKIGLLKNDQGCVNVNFDIINNGFKKIEEIEINIKEHNAYLIVEKPEYVGDLSRGEKKKVYFKIKPSVFHGVVEIFFDITYKNCKQNKEKRIQITVREEEVKEWQRIISPYRVGKQAEDDNLFVGRQEQIEIILESIERQDPVFIVGHRRMGKTSLAKYMLYKYFSADEYIPCFTSAEECVWEAKNDSQTETGRNKNTINFLYSFSIQICVNLLLYDIITKAEKDKYMQEIADQGLIAFNNFMNNIFTELLIKKKVLVIAIDEYPQILEAVREGLIDSRFLSNLRGYYQNKSKVFRMIFTGASSLKYIRAEYTSSVMGVGKTVEVSFFSDEETKTLISRPLNNKITFDTSAYKYLMDLTNGQPYYTNCILDKIISKLNSEKNRLVVHKEDFESGLQEYIYQIEYLSVDWIKDVETINLKWTEIEKELAITYKHLIIALLSDYWAKTKSGLSKASIYMEINAKLNMYHKINKINFEEVLSILAGKDDILSIRNDLYCFKVGLFREWIINKENLTFDKVLKEKIELLKTGGKNE